LLVGRRNFEDGELCLLLHGQCFVTIAASSRMSIVSWIC
jgi:hypothetical protein